MRGLTLIVATGDSARFHAALAMAAASAATGAATRVYLHGDAVALLAPAPLRAPDDERFGAAGLPTLAQILEEAFGLGVGLICCQSGLLLAGIAADAIDPRIEIGGLVGLFGALGDDRLVAV